MKKSAMCAGSYGLVVNTFKSQAHACPSCGKQVKARFSMRLHNQMTYGSAKGNAKLAAHSMTGGFQR